MKKLQLLHSILTALTLASATSALAQNGLPASQPKRLTIIREEVKVGRSADHARHEAGWPAAFEKVKSPDYYVAMTSMTGPTEAWYLVPSDSYASEGASMKRDDKDPVLSAELGRLALRDSEFINSSTTIHTTSRPELGIGKFPDVAKIRFYRVTTYSVRPGQTEKFEALLKLSGAARLRAAPDSSFRVYSVAAGMASPTYMIFSSVEDYAQFDQQAAERKASREAMTAAEKAEMDKYGDIVVRSQTNIFRVDPVQSYVSKEVRAQDPEFWQPK